MRRRAPLETGGISPVSRDMAKPGIRTAQPFQAALGTGV